jgi:ADP-heptose:LPS heptosyltransferase
VSHRFLIIRFSAIGDVVLTTPVIRSLKKAFPQSRIHYLTKQSNKALLEYNPYVDTIHLLEDSLDETINELSAFNFDHIFDLHHNLRSLRVKRSLKAPSAAFFKANRDKWLLCQKPLRSFAKNIDHVVTRYGATLSGVGAALDGEGLDLFLPKETEHWAAQTIHKAFGEMPPLAVVLGATWATKRWLTAYFAPALNALGKAVLLIGGPDMQQESRAIAEDLEVPFLNAVGTYGLLESAALMKQAQSVIAHDTGFMHIAAAFGQRIISIWGNTVPEFGMSPWNTDYTALEEKGLSCRPCSKIGHDRCPKGHFKCMKDISPEMLVEAVQGGMENEERKL